MGNVRSTSDGVMGPVSINWTITTQCSYRCRYCFARFPELQNMCSLSWKQKRKIPGILAEAGCQKLTFVGGEPTLDPHLPNLLRIAKDCGLTTMIVTNGTTLQNDFLATNCDHLDWVSLSIDSQFEEIEVALGRGTGNHVAQTIENVKILHEYGIHIKLNTVVTSLNFNEDMCGFVQSLGPNRWKAFQVLLVNGQNESTVVPLLISSQEFEIFKRLHQPLVSKSLNVVFENNTAMRGSYLMLDPLGRFFTNWLGEHEYTLSIFEIGVEQALEHVMWDSEKFIRRGGIYSWSPQNLSHQVGVRR